MNQQFLEAISIFVFMYPAGMAIYWVSASLCYYLFMEGKLGQPTFQQMPKERVPMAVSYTHLTLPTILLV